MCVSIKESRGADDERESSKRSREKVDREAVVVKFQQSVGQKKLGMRHESERKKRLTTWDEKSVGWGQ